MKLNGSIAEAARQRKLQDIRAGIERGGGEIHELPVPDAVRNSLETGELLLQAADILAAAEWEPWVASALPFDKETASLLMRAAFEYRAGHGLSLSAAQGVLATLPSCVIRRLFDVPILDPDCGEE